MYEQNQQIAQYMSKRGRVIRYAPPTGVPAGERVEQIEHLINTLWPLAASLGIDLGRKPTIVYTCAPLAPPSAILGHTLHHLIETFTILHAFGLSHATTLGIHRICSSPVTNPGPNLTDLCDPSDDDQDQILKS